MDELTSGAEYIPDVQEDEIENSEDQQVEDSQEDNVYTEISADDLPIGDFVGIGFLCSGTGLVLALSVSYLLSLLKRA